MRGLHEAGEFIGGNHGNRLVSPSAHDHNFMVIRHAIKHGRQTLTQIRVCSFDQKWPLLQSVQDSCTLVNDQSAATALGTGCAAMARQSRTTFGRMAARAITVQTTASTPTTPSRETGGSGMIIRETVNTMAKG